MLAMPPPRGLMDGRHVWVGARRCGSAIPAPAPGCPSFPCINAYRGRGEAQLILQVVLHSQ